LAPKITVSGARRMGPVSFQALKFLMCRWVSIGALTVASWLRLIQRGCAFACDVLQKPESAARVRSTRCAGCRRAVDGVSLSAIPSFCKVTLGKVMFSHKPTLVSISLQQS
jgi:hypothetical protein